MANVLTILKLQREQSRFELTGTIVLSGSYVQAANGGEVLNFATATLPIGDILPNFGGIYFFEAQGNNGYSYGPFAALPQAYPSQFLVPIKIATASATELSAGSYPAGITGDYIQFTAHCKKMA